MAAYGPQLPIQELVFELNRLYHACEARSYDARHPEISRQLPPLWSEMIGCAGAALGTEAWRVLDFGCGTGFEAEQILSNVENSRIELLTCYDPCPEMVERCRERLGALSFPGAVVCSELPPTPEGGAKYNVLATNSLLHHLADPAAAVAELLPSLSPNAIHLAGHEPSNRFYRNAECLAAFESFKRERKWRKFLSPGKYLQRLGRALRPSRTPAFFAAQ
ncbi:MAG: class I SAM-dependent methyltransferase, partial [Planctomycetota bacterium]